MQMPQRSSFLSKPSLTFASCRSRSRGSTAHALHKTLHRCFTSITSSNLNSFSSSSSSRFAIPPLHRLIHTTPSLSFSSPSSSSTSSSTSSVPSIPLIDLSPSFSSSPSSKLSVANSIASACRDLGFFTITGHRIPSSLISHTWLVTQQYFDQEEAFKNRIPMTKDYPYGYSGVGAEDLQKGYKLGEGVRPAADPKESFSVGPYNPAALMPPQLWPSSPPLLQQYWHEYYVAMEELAAHLLRLMALGLHLPENWFDDKLTRHRSALRALNYPGQLQPPVPGSIRAGQHTDYGSVTILLQDRVGGLQVKNKKGEWQDVGWVEDSFVINLGDLMSRWTNDEWVSTLHRVIHPMGKPREEAAARRQSMAFFHNINYDYVVDCIPTCTDEKRPKKYEPIKAWDLLIQKHAASVGKY